MKSEDCVAMFYYYNVVSIANSCKDLCSGYTVATYKLFAQFS